MKKLFSLLVLTLPLFVMSQIPEPKPNTYVNDEGFLSADQVRILNDSLLSFEKRTSVQVAVLLVHKLPDNMEIEDFAREVGRKWKVGNAANGLVYVVVVDQHKQRLEVSSHLEGAIPDVVAKELTDQIKPDLHNGNYFAAMQKLIAGIRSKIEPEKEDQLQLAQKEADKKDTGSGWWWNLLIMPFGALAGYLFSANRRKKNAIKEDLERQERLRNRKLYSGPSSLYRQNPLTQNDMYIPPTSIPDSDTSSSSSSSSSSSTDNSSSYGDWGSGSSGNDSTSGFSGGGASNDF